MGTSRNGARTFLTILHKACKLSHTAGFVTGLRTILGVSDANTLYALWTPLCSFVEALVGVDHYFNQIDFVEETSGSEDISGGS